MPQLLYFLLSAAAMEYFIIHFTIKTSSILLAIKSTDRQTIIYNWNDRDLQLEDSDSDHEAEISQEEMFDLIRDRIKRGERLYQYELDVMNHFPDIFEATASVPSAHGRGRASLDDDFIEVSDNELSFTTATVVTDTSM